MYPSKWANGHFMKILLPPLCQEMHFRPIGRKKFFTQAEWASSLPQASKRENSECPPKTLLLFGVHSLFSLLLAWGGEGAHSAWVKNFFLPISLKCISWHKDGIDIEHYWNILFNSYWNYCNTIAIVSLLMLWVRFGYYWYWNCYCKNIR